MTIAEHASSDLPSIGEVVDGRFEIRAELGEGGMGHVFRAYDRSAGREVALKLLIPRYLGRPERELRLFREAELGQRVQHPNLVTYLDVGRLGLHAWPFLVMEFIDGGDLGMRLIEGALEGRLATSVARQIAGAVHALHRAGIVHRDVTAMNVLFDGGHATLIDLSHAGDLSLPKVPVGRPGRLTQLNEVPGTHHYMSREQANAEPADPAMDVYAFGITLVHILTGRAPRGYGREAFIEMQRRGLIESPRIDPRIYAEAPVPLIELAHACVRQGAGDRPTMEEIVEQLDGLPLAPVVPIHGARGRDPDAPRPRSRRAFVPPPEPTIPASRPHDAPLPEPPPSRTSGAARSASEAAAVAEASYGPAPRRAQRRLIVILAVLLLISLGIVSLLLFMLAGEQSPGVEPESRTESSADPRPEIEPEPAVEPGPEPPRTETETVPPETPPSSTAAVPPAGSPSVGVTPVEPTSTPEAEPGAAKAKRDRSRPTRRRSTTPTPAEDCDGVDEKAHEAARTRDWKHVLQYTRAPSCWADARSRVRLRVRALVQLRRYDECVVLAKTIDDTETNRAAVSCAAALKASKP